VSLLEIKAIKDFIKLVQLARRYKLEEAEAAEAKE